MRRHVHTLVLTFAVLVAATSAAVAAPFHPTPVGSDRAVTVMTRNLYFGADLTPVITATSAEDFLAAAVGAFQTSQASDFPSRAAAVAREIAANDAALVGLQEATWWRVGALGDPAPANQVLTDFVALIQAELAALGEPYEVLASVEGFDAELPVAAIGVDVRLTVGDVMLRRANLPWLQVTDVHTGSYATTVSFDTPIGPLSFPRQWIAADVRVRGESARVITTHLESVAAFFRTAQAGELLAGPADTSMPVAIMGDLNAEAGDVGDSAATIIADGFADAWAAVHGAADGSTFGHDALLRDPTTVLDEQIDFVLTRGGLVITDVRRTGVDPDPTLSPLGVLYPSDHAGVVADLVLPR